MTTEWTDRLSEYLDGTLTPEERRACESWLQSSADGRVLLDELRRVVARAKTLPDAAVPESVWQGVAAGIRSSVPRSVAREAPELARQPLPAPRRRLLEREQPDADGWIDEPARLDHQQGDERPRERTAQPGHPVRFHRPPSLDSARCSAIYPPRCV